MPKQRKAALLLEMWEGKTRSWINEDTESPAEQRDRVVGNLANHLLN